MGGVADGPRARSSVQMMDFRAQHGNSDVPRGRAHRWDYADGMDTMAESQRGQEMRVAASPSGSPMQTRMGMLSPQSHDPWNAEPRATNSRLPQSELGGWGSNTGGGGLGETFAPRGPAPTTFAPTASYEPMRRPGNVPPAHSEQWGGGLDELMPPRQRLPPNIAQAYAEQARREQREQGGVPPKLDPRNQPPDDWGGMSLGDALGPKRRAEQADSYHQATPSPPYHSVQNDVMHDPKPSAFVGTSDELDGQVVAPPRQPSSHEAQRRGSAPEARRSPPPPRGRPSAQVAAGDDAWGGQSLSDALAPKRAAAAPPAPEGSGGGSSGSRGGGQCGRASAAPRPRAGGPAALAGGPVGAAECTKTPEEIVAWVRSLPESHVPEKAREHIAAIVEDEGIGGAQFSQYVQHVPPEICAPKHAMKLKAAWANVLKEAAAREVALSNLANQPKQKATMIVV